MNLEILQAIQNLLQSIAIVLIVTWLVFIERETTRLMNISQQEEKPIKRQFKPSKLTEETEEEKQYKTILNNIDNYDGTSKGQQKVR